LQLAAQKTNRTPNVQMNNPLRITDSLWQKPLALSLEAATRSIEEDINPVTYGIQKSILAYEYKPIPKKPYFDFSDRNNFEAIYKTKNLAFYESLKNTAVSQLYNPFALHKQL